MAALRLGFRMYYRFIATEAILCIIQASKITSQSPSAQLRVTTKWPFSSSPPVAGAGGGTTAGFLTAIKNLVLVSSQSQR